MQTLHEPQAPETAGGGGRAQETSLVERWVFENQIHSRMRAAASTKTATTSIIAITAQKSQA
jgi:hypothetical protein